LSKRPERCKAMNFIPTDYSLRRSSVARRPKIVEAHIETRAGFCRIDVKRRVAYIDRHDFEIRGLETRRAFVERRGGQGIEQPDELWNWVIRPFGIGGMPWRPATMSVPLRQPRRAEHRKARWLADDAMIEPLAIFIIPARVFRCH
jgi:hypothetical protein